MDFDIIYSIIKSLHIIAIICWMIGLLYLPRLFVYHSKAQIGSELDKTLQIMEKNLLRFIMNPSMIFAIILGLTMAYFIGFNYIWLHIKLSLVLLLAAFHGFLAHCRKNFTREENKYSTKFYRLINEIPAILLIAIVFLVILKPFS